MHSWPWRGRVTRRSHLARKIRRGSGWFIDKKKMHTPRIDLRADAHVDGRVTDTKPLGLTQRFHPNDFWLFNHIFSYF